MKLKSIIDKILSPYYLNYSNIIEESEGKEYNAHTLLLDNKTTLFREAKTTPTKDGLFVTLWKRNSQGITAPYDLSDNFDIVIISCSQQEHSGLFIFNKAVLQKHNIISTLNHDGKRGFRVYPNWTTTTNKQAQKTQIWQLNYFVDTTNITLEVTEKIKALLF